MSKAIVTTYFFASESSPDKLYQALVYDDGTTSCECKGWIFKRRNVGGDRTCKHTRLIESGLAERHCERKVEHRNRQVNTQRPARMATDDRDISNPGRMIVFE